MRDMRILLMFDLPVTTPKLRKRYAQFRKRLEKSGFDMVQYSVYSRHCHNYESASNLVQSVTKFSPEEGSIRYLIITEKQYAEMGFILGEFSAQEQLNNGCQLAFL